MSPLRYKGVVVVRDKKPHPRAKLGRGTQILVVITAVTGSQFYVEIFIKYVFRSLPKFISGSTMRFYL